MFIFQKFGFIGLYVSAFSLKTSEQHIPHASKIWLSKMSTTQYFVNVYKTLNKINSFVCFCSYVRTRLLCESQIETYYLYLLSGILTVKNIHEK